jgi:hypothetical protein
MTRPIDPTLNNNFVCGIVVGGHDADPDPNQNGLMRIYLPQYHGNNVKKEHFGFSPMIMPPNQGGANEFNGVPDPGQSVMCLKSGPPGDSSLIVLGTIPTNRQDGGQPGNMNLNTALKALTEAFAAEIKINIPPNVKETTDGGARVRQIQEKGQKHKHDLLKGLQSHGAAYSTAGITHKQLTNVSTATQAFSNILTGSMMSALPGTNFSVSNILNSLTSSVLDELLSSVSPELSQGMQNMFTLMQSMEISESGGFSTMGKVDPTTYLANAVNLLKGNQSLGEVIENLKRLQSDTSLFGLDKLANASFDIPTAFGVIKMSLSPTGEILNETPEAVQKAVELFSGLMSSGAGFPGVGLDNMFGGSSPVMSELFNRLPPDKQTIAKNMMEQAVAPGSEARTWVNKANEVAQTGANIFGALRLT